MSAAPRKLVVALIVSVLFTAAPICEGKRIFGSSSSRKSSTNRRTSVTKPPYNPHSASNDNSHADAAKLSYPNYNSQPNRPASAATSNNQPIGWIVPNHGNAGPQPSYSASNVPGGAKTNMHVHTPSYQNPNYGAALPSYNHATGTNNGAANQYHKPAAIPAGVTYHSPNNVPQGATYYNNPSHVPGGFAGGGSNSGGYHAPAGGASSYSSPQNLPQGGLYVARDNPMPSGAVVYPSPPQQTSSGLGFGSGLTAGALGGAILGHLLTPTGSKDAEKAPASGVSSDGGKDRIIIINNGQPVNATDANGVTVINNPGVNQAPATAVAGESPAPLVPMAPQPAATTGMAQNAPNPSYAPPLAPIQPPDLAMNNGTAPANPVQPPPGGIICVPMRVNETDPNDATKNVEVERHACYPAPPPPPQPQVAVDPNTPAAPVVANPAVASAPLAPMQPLTPGASSQQLQQESTMIGNQTIKSVTDSASAKEKSFVAFLMCFALSYLVAYN